MNPEPDSTGPAGNDRLRRRMVAAGLSVGLLAGGAAGAVMGTSGISGAQDTTTTAPATEDTAPDEAAPEDGERRGPGQFLEEALAPLVADGTLTQEQADKVIQALRDARPPGGGHGPGHGARGQGLEAAATALGMEPDDLREQLRDGKTLAEVAQDKGVDPQVVIDALVAEVKTHLDEKVAAGDLTQAEADERLAEATERITDRVNNGHPEGPPEDAPAEDTEGD